MSKHICITGCTKGLGLALAKWFLANGWQVSGVGRNQNSIDSLQSHNNGYFRSVDITDDIGLGLFAKELADHFGPPDLLVNNAGVINANAPIWEVPPMNSVKSSTSILRESTIRSGTLLPS